MYIDHYRLHPRAGVHGWGWPFSICLFYSLSYLSLLNDYCSDRTPQVCITEFLFQPGSKMIALWHAHCHGKTNMNKVGLSVPVSLQDLFFKPYRAFLVMSFCQHRLSCKAIKRQRWAERRAGEGWSQELCRWCCAQGLGRRTDGHKLCPGVGAASRVAEALSGQRAMLQGAASSVAVLREGKDWEPCPRPRWRQWAQAQGIG